MGKFKLKTTFIKENIENIYVEKCEEDFDKESDLFDELEYQYTNCYNLCEEANYEFIEELKKMRGGKLDGSLEKDLDDLVAALDEKFLGHQDAEYYYKRNFTIHYALDIKYL
jgi:hypothetical protein